MMKEGDTCLIQPGTYRESVVLRSLGTKKNPIRFVGATNDDGSPAVVIDGTDLLTAPWTKVEVNGIQAMSAEMPRQTTQLFYNGRMMTEARWPDQTFQQIWDRSTWAKSAEGSRKDKLVCKELAATNIDWTGAIAMLNVGHQYKTWSRIVTAHQKGSTTFSYALAERMNDGKDDGRTWWDDRFYLIGKIEALSSPEEWFYDEANKRLLFVPPENAASPTPVPKLKKGKVTFKARDYGFSGRDLEYVEISGLKFFACTFNFQKANHLTIENCQVLYPNYARVLTDSLPRTSRTDVKQTHISGNNNTLRKISVAYGNTAGIKLTGTHNRVENSIVHDVCWGGSLSHPAVMVHGYKDVPCESTVARCTIYNTGNVGIWFLRQNNVIEYNHVSHTGLACKDIAAIHTGSPACAGSIARYNWVHDSRGKGMRADDQSRKVSFHHNVVWNCDEGIIVKGDFNQCYNNTILGTDGSGSLIIPTRPEPQKWWAKGKFLEVQNANSIFCNNLSEVLSYRHDPLPDTRNISHNIQLANTPLLAPWIAASRKQNFHLAKDSILIDAGVSVPGSAVEYSGKSPDVGAYEFGKKNWRPGADWQAPSIGIKLTIHAEVARSWQRDAQAKQRSIPIPQRLSNSRLSSASLGKLQELYDDCWTPRELASRRAIIEKRQKHRKDSPEYKELHEQVVTLHRNATARLKKRAGEVLGGSELMLFNEISN